MAVIEVSEKAQRPDRPHCIPTHPNPAPAPSERHEQGQRAAGTHEMRTVTTFDGVDWTRFWGMMSTAIVIAHGPRPMTQDRPIHLVLLSSVARALA